MESRIIESQQSSFVAIARAARQACCEAAVAFFDAIVNGIACVASALLQQPLVIRTYSSFSEVHLPVFIRRHDFRSVTADQRECALDRERRRVVAIDAVNCGEHAAVSWAMQEECTTQFSSAPAFVRTPDMPLLKIRHR